MAHSLAAILSSHILTVHVSVPGQGMEKVPSSKLHKQQLSACCMIAVTTGEKWRGADKEVEKGSGRAGVHKGGGSRE